MASFVYTKAKQKILQGSIDFVNDTFKIALVMSNTTADTEEDTEFVSGLTTLDECDGSGYSRQTLASLAVNIDTGSDVARFDSANATFASLGAGTRQVVGVVLFKFVTDDTDSPLIAYIDQNGFPFDGIGTNVNILVHANGWLEI